MPQRCLPIQKWSHKVSLVSECLQHFLSLVTSPVSYRILLGVRMPARVWEEDGFHAALGASRLQFSLFGLLFIFLRQGLSLAWNSPSRLEWLAREPGAPLSVSPDTWITARTTMSMGSGGSNSGPWAWKASALLTDLLARALALWDF